MLGLLPLHFSPVYDPLKEAEITINDNHDRILMVPGASYFPCRSQASILPPTVIRIIGAVFRLLPISI